MARERREGRPGRSGAGKGIAAAAVVVAAAGAAFAALGFDPRSFGGTAEPEASQEAPATAEVVRRTLTETVTTDGDLGYGDATGLHCLLNGTVTALPAVGDVIARGERVYAVDDRPVVLLYGSLPAYRTLASGVEGADVEQFEKNLAALGYDGFTVDDEYTEVTAAAVKRWQKDLGLEQTGVVEFGRVVFAPGAIRVDAVGLEPGDPVGPGTAVLDHTGLDKVVTVEVDLAHQALVVVGGPVTVTLPDGTEATGTVTDVVTRVGDRPDQGGDTAEVTYLEVTIAADDPAVFDDLDQAAVKVGFPGTTAEDVLTVPIAALLGLAEGGYGLEVVTDEGTALVAVDTGLFAEGSVEVSGAGLEEGQAVVVPS